jgi:hypothetical protein
MITAYFDDSGTIRAASTVLQRLSWLQAFSEPKAGWIASTAIGEGTWLRRFAE